MKTIFKLFTLLLISMLAIPVIAVADSTMPDNYTDNYTEHNANHQIDTNDEESDDINDEKYIKHGDEVIADMEREYAQMEAINGPHNVCINGVEYLQSWPSPEEINDLAIRSQAKGNYTFEQEIIAYDDRIPFDTYMVTESDGSRHTVVVVYNNKESHTVYGRSQFYADQHRVSVVTPTPMAICKPLYIKALNEQWNMKTAVITSYKIVYSHYGREIIDEVEPTTPEPEQHIQPIEPKTVPPHRVPSEDNSIDNSTVINNSTVQNNTNSNAESYSNISANFSNTNIDFGNNTGDNTSGDNVGIVGIGNKFYKLYISLTNATNNIINFNF